MNTAPPPRLDNDTVFETWKKEVEIWLYATGLPKTRQAATLIMAMRDSPKRVALNMDVDVIKSEDGVKRLIEELEPVFKEDDTQCTFSSIERFEKFYRLPEQSMKDFVSAFAERHRDLKKRLPTAETLYSTEILAYRLLQQANLSEEQKRLVKATCTEIKYETMVSQLKKTFGEGCPPPAPGEKPVMKEEPDDFKTEVMYVKRNSNNASSSADWVKTAKCFNCDKVGHLARNCRSGGNSKNSYKSNYKRRDEVWEVEEELYLTLADEAGIRGVLDTGASSTVCGTEWLRRYEEYNCVRVERRQSSKSFRFGDGESIESLFVCELTVRLCEKTFSLPCHVLSINVPLLLSREALKTWRAVINFAADQIEIDGKTTDIHLTSTGHSVIDLSPDCSPDRILTVTHSTSHLTPVKIANKLHKFFSHGSKRKIKDLVGDSSHPEKTAIMEAIDNLQCEECMRLARSKPKRKVGMTLGRKFNSVVCMDLKLLKFADGKASWVLHMICSLTRFSVMVPVKSKAAEEIVEKIFSHWISVFGRPEKFLTDNGGEFVNEPFLEMASRLDIDCKVTPAESPSCNGITERHNGILGNMVIKTRNETGCTVATACSWASNAKNCLANHFGFSPHQLVFGYNPSVPSVLTDQHRPAHGGEVCESDLVEQHLTARRVARLKFLETESNYKLDRVIKSKGRYQDKTRYVSGDRVYYKREAQKSWLGPATVIGSMDNQVLVKHGGLLYRVHPCKLQLKESAADCQRNDKDEDSRNTREEDFGNDQGEGSRNERDEDQIVIEDTTEDADDSNVEKVPEENTEVAVTDDRNDRARGNTGTVKKKKKPVISRDYSLRPRGNQPMDNQQPEAEEEIPEEEIPEAEEEIPEAEEEIPEAVQEAEAEETEHRNELEEETVVMIEEEEIWFYASADEKEIRSAKDKEIAKMKEFNVFEEVPDDGEKKISTRWVFTRKDDGELKARLVARGFEEELLKPTDSPTVSKFIIRILLGLAAAPTWKLKSIDVKSAFLQSDEIDREVYISPPKEIRRAGYVWKLKKSLYGLGDAPRRWYFTISTALKDVCKLSRIDKTTFYACEDGKPIGIITIHVDDLLLAGTEDFFKKVEPAILNFKLGKIESSSFTYLGWEIDKDKDKITLSQDSYAKMTRDDVTKKLQMNPMPLAAEELNEEQQEVMRSCIGKLSWLAHQTMPQHCFSLLELTTKSNWKGSDVRALKKVARRLEPTQIVFRDLNWEKATLHVYADASLANLDEYKSGSGYIIFLEDGEVRNLVTYVCGKVKRVVKSVFAAELYSLSEGVSEAILIRHFLAEMIDKPIEIIAWTDSRQVHDAVKTISSSPRDKKTTLELREIQDLVQQDNVEVKWVSSKANPADVFTKKGVPSERLLDFLRQGRLANSERQDS